VPPVSSRSRGGVCCSLTSPTKTKSFAGEGADKALLFPAIRQRLSRGVDMACQSRFRHNSPIPDRVQQVVLADHMLAVTQQIDQKVKHLRAECNPLGSAPQLAPISIQSLLFKQILHRTHASVSGSDDMEETPNRLLGQADTGREPRLNQGPARECPRNLSSAWTENKQNPMTIRDSHKVF
jgi:hypothetical protein